MAKLIKVLSYNSRITYLNLSHNQIAEWKAEEVKVRKKTDYNEEINLK